MAFNFDAPSNTLLNKLSLKGDNPKSLQLDNKLTSDKTLENTNKLNNDFLLKNHYNLTHDTFNTLENNISIANRGLEIDNGIPEVSLTDNARLCLKTLVSPLAIFFHIGKFALASVTTTLSFAVAFAISDLIFFSLLDKFALAYPRYVLLGVTGVVALFSIKGIASSFVNFFLSFFKGTYSWYFSLLNPDCSFSDFLFGRNKITKNSN